MIPDQGSTGRTITTLSSREVYRNHWMRLREDEILRSNGEKGIYGVVEKDDAAIILPIDEGRVWLVEQFRYADSGAGAGAAPGRLGDGGRQSRGAGARRAEGGDWPGSRRR